MTDLWEKEASARYRITVKGLWAATTKDVPGFMTVRSNRYRPV